MARLVLASLSPTRRQLLARAGLTFEAIRPAVDERILKADMAGLSPAELAVKLAEAKAVSVANRLPDTLVIGADQVLDLAGRPLDKPARIEDARAQLIELRAKRHCLETAVCCAVEGRVTWRHAARASLVMRAFSDLFLDRYVEEMGADLLTSVGGYQLEGRGSQLFETVEGDYFTILGLPLLPLLGYLRTAGFLPS